MKTQSLDGILHERIKLSANFRQNLLAEAVTLMLTDDLQTAKDLLIHYINGTLGFAALAELLERSPAEIARILRPSSNPAAKDLLHLVAVLAQSEGVTLSLNPTDWKPRRQRAGDQTTAPGRLRTSASPAKPPHLTPKAA